MNIFPSKEQQHGEKKPNIKSPQTKNRDLKQWKMPPKTLASSSKTHLELNENSNKLLQLVFWKESTAILVYHHLRPRTLFP